MKQLIQIAVETTVIGQPPKIEVLVPPDMPPMDVGAFLIIALREIHGASMDVVLGIQNELMAYQQTFGQLPQQNPAGQSDSGLILPPGAARGGLANKH